MVVEEVYKQLQRWSVTWTLQSKGRGRPSKKDEGQEDFNSRQIQFYNQIASKWCFQLEAGEKSGTMHYQIQLNLKRKATKQALLKSFVDYFKLDASKKAYIHISATSNLGERASFTYCMNEDTRVGAFFCDASYYYGKDLEVFNEKPRPFSDDDSCIIKGHTRYS